MYEDRRGPIGASGAPGPSEDLGPTGLRGMPGLTAGPTELDTITMLIVELEKADYYGERSGFRDGENPKTAVDSFALNAAIRALKNYEALLCQPLYKLVPPGFFEVDRPPKSIQGVR